MLNNANLNHLLGEKEFSEVKNFHFSNNITKIYPITGSRCSPKIINIMWFNF